MKDSASARRPLHLHRVSVTLAVMLGVLLACDSSTDRPNAPSGPVVIVLVTVNAPASLAPGQSAQLTATAVRSDRSTEAATAQWSSSDPAVVQVDAAGVATAIAAGEVTVTASVEGRSGEARILALPSGTFKLSGRVVEEGRPVEGVSLTVTEGIGQGLTATSGSSGTFALYGVAGRVQVRARKDEYRETLREVSVNSNATENFEIAISRIFKNAGGTYTLTLTAATCLPGRGSLGTLPDVAKTRRYTAAVIQDGSELSVTLSGGNFLLNGRGGNSFFGHFDGEDTVFFAIGRDADVFYPYFYYYHDQFSVVERLDDTSSLVIIGNVSARVTATEITGTMNGILMTWSGKELPLQRMTSMCSSASHGFVMRRQ